MKQILLITACLTNLTLIAQTSPWGTGSISNQLIGDVQNTSVIFASQSGWGNLGYYPDPNTLLPTYTYDLYIPSAYDGTEEYGLITYVNSGNNGGIPSSWQAVLDEKKLIMISGDNIGNSVNIDIRMGVAMAAVYRLREILNIDDGRIYTSGNSGGGRMGSLLALTYPEWFQGSMPNCGCSYLREVDQDYETQNPNSNYEYIIPFSATFLDYVKTFDRRYAILTAYNDFREGDIMNIYHNGMEEDGFKGKFLETSGGHCSTNTAHFRDAVNFVEHPHIPVIYDEFTATPQVGDGFKNTSSSIIGQQLVLDHTLSNMASAYSRNPFVWNDDEGAIFRTSLTLDSAAYNQNSFVNIGLLDFSDTLVFDEVIGHELYSGKPNFIVNIVFDAAQPTVHLLANNPSNSISNDTLFSGVFNDWDVDTILDIKMHLWNQEIRVEFSNHFDPNVTVGGPMVTYLDDNRSIQIRTENSYWAPSDFSSGTLLTLVSGKLNSASLSAAASIEKVEVVAASNDIPPILINTTGLTSIKQDRIVAYPNPGNGLFNIITDSKGEIEMKIYASNGVLVQTHIHSGAYSQIDLSQADVGIYFLQASSSIQPIKLIVNN